MMSERSPEDPDVDGDEMSRVLKYVVSLALLAVPALWECV